MKNVLFYLPAILYTIAVIMLNIILRTFSPLWYIWITLLWLSGFLFSKGKTWSVLLGLIPAVHILYMGTQYTGQIINIEIPLGVATALYVIGCSLWVWKNYPIKQIKE